ncbi:MAG: hypothetical protein M1818_005434 [Claussenomyces sp. TS43310]|nr:MAG: hypothetical protein M1818_005434 [Claussenomyces sp. TS43310]
MATCTLPVSKSLSDYLIEICAGRSAIQRIERNRTARYFKSLPGIPDDQTWNSQFTGCEMGVVPGQRSLKKPWEKPNFGITFRYRHDCHDQNLPATASLPSSTPCELQLTGQSPSQSAPRLRVASSKISPSWSSEPACSVPTAALLSPVPLIPKGLSIISGTEEKINGRSSVCMYLKVQDPTFSGHTPCLNDHSQTDDPTRLKTASVRRYEPVSTVLRDDDPDIANERTTKLAGGPSDRSIARFYNYQPEGAEKHPNNGIDLDDAAGSRYGVECGEEEIRARKLLYRDILGRNPHHRICHKVSMTVVAVCAQTAPPISTIQEFLARQRMRQHSFPDTLILRRDQTKDLLDIWTLNVTPPTQIVRRLEAQEREWQERQGARGRAWRTRNPETLARAPSAGLETRTRPTAKEQERASNEVQAQISSGLATSFPTPIVQCQSPSYNKRPWDVSHSPTSKTDLVAAAAQKHASNGTVVQLAQATSPPIHARLTNSENDPSIHPKGFVNDHLLQTKAQRDLPRYLPHLFPTKSRLEPKPEPGLRNDVGEIQRAAHRIQLSSPQKMTAKQIGSSCGGLNTSEYAILDSEDEQEDSQTTKEGTMPMGDRQQLSSSKAIRAQHIVEQEKTESLTAMCRWEVVNADTKASDNDWDPAWIVEDV